MPVRVQVTGTNAGGSTVANSSSVTVTGIEPINWTVATTGTSNNFNGVTFGAGRFVASGSSSTIRNTVNGTSWAASTGASATNQRGTFFNGRFIIGTATSNVITSTDGLAFNSTAVSVFSYAVSSSDTRAAGSANGGTGQTWYTTDGITFNNNAGPGNAVYSVLVDDPYVYAGSGVGFGGLRRTTDFSSWSTVTHALTSGNVIGIAKGGGVHIAMTTTGQVSRSTDGGSTFTLVPVTLSNTPLGLKYLNGIFIAVALSGIIHYSIDTGLTWVTINTGLSARLNDVAFGNGRFLVVGESGAAAWSIPS